MTLPVRRRVAMPRGIALTRGRVADSACFLTMKETDQEDVATEIQEVAGMLLCLDQQGKEEGNLRREAWRKASVEVTLQVAIQSWLDGVLYGVPHGPEPAPKCTG